MTVTPPDRRVQDQHMDEWKCPHDRPGGTYVKELDSIGQYPSMKGFALRDMGVCSAIKVQDGDPGQLYGARTVVLHLG